MEIKLHLNDNKKDSMFYFASDCCGEIKIKYKDTDYTLFAVVHGEKRVYDSDGQRIDTDLNDLYKSDEDLKNAIVNEDIEVENNNWYNIEIYGNNTVYYTDVIFNSIEEFECMEETEVIELLDKFIK